MKAWLMAGATMAAIGSSAMATEPARVAESVKATPLLLAQQRRSTPDTSMPGSTGPGNPIPTRPNYVSRQDQYLAAELRKCETIGEATQRLACKDSARNRFGEM
jgi:hypothetical protein